MKEIIEIENIINKILLDIPKRNFVIKGSSAPALINWFTTLGSTNANNEIITMIEKLINTSG